MSIGRDTIKVFRGEDVILEFKMAAEDGDITDWSIHFTVRSKFGVITIEGDATITDGPAGEFNVALSSDDTDVLSGTYDYDVWRVDDGSEHVMAVGDFIVQHVARLPLAVAP